MNILATLAVPEIISSCVLPFLLAAIDPFAGATSKFSGLLTD
jgi:hypothetical protein